MIEQMKRGRTEAETCALNGWTVGTQLVGDQGYGPTVIEITAIGESSILAKAVKRNHLPVEDDREMTWTLECREWEPADHTADQGPRQGAGGSL